jgi:hypothetical protein
MSNTGFEIKLPTPYKYEAKILKKFEELNEKGKEIFDSLWGYPEMEAIFYLYLFKKYKSNCFLYSNTDNDDFRFFGLTINIMSKQSKSTTRLYNTHINLIANSFTECVLRNVKTIIVPIVIYDNKETTHANVLIYRKKFNQIEHFEPHGSYYMADKKLANKIKVNISKFITEVNSILKENEKSEINYIPSDQVCPTEEGLQSLEGFSTLPSNEYDDAGYCLPWNMFFTELALANPNLESSKLFDIITNYFKDKTNIEDYLRKVIHGYTFFIDEKVTKYLSIILGENITVKTIHKLNLDFVKNVDKITQVRYLIRELIKLEIDMLKNPDFNIEREFKSVKGMLRKKENKNDYFLLLKKKVLENYNKFNKFTPVTTKATTEIEITSKNPETKAITEKKCPEGKVLNPKTKRCNKIKTNSKTKKNKSSIKFQTI